MIPIPQERLELFRMVLKNKRVVGFHAANQPLIDHLCEIINIQAKNIDELVDELEKHESTWSGRV